MEYMTISRNPYELDTGSAFTMVVNDCRMAKYIDSNEGVTGSYDSDVECDKSGPSSDDYFTLS